MGSPFGSHRPALSDTAAPQTPTFELEPEVVIACHEAMIAAFASD